MTHFRDPSDLTESDRRREISKMFGVAYLRLVTRPANLAENSQNGLAEEPGHRRVSAAVKHQPRDAGAA